MDRVEIVLRFIDKGIGVKGARLNRSRQAERSIRRSIWFLSGMQPGSVNTIYARVREN